MANKVCLQKSQKCPICSEFVSKGNKKSHIDMHFRIKEWQCQFCKKVFSNWESFQAHQLVHSKTTNSNESLNNSDVIVDSGSKKLQSRCKYCPKKFKSPSLMTTHVLRHSDKRRYTCHLCFKEFKDPYYIWEHLKTAHPKTNNNSITVKEMFDRQNSSKKPIVTPVEFNGKDFQLKVGVPDSMKNVNLWPRVILSRELTDAMSKCVC
ncbi:zinc finger protein 737-like isoform X1 [Daphnia pulicaria]|uniref:zinc finger protein 737-like isoform X1 n=1 Tax=Daphnia pulicaria TaxID=35523 RepID=UPI001EEB6887|nr:zinc finger protein 737-like isoform X1 [Daphnia pulicaria]XP_046658022.1 zinc finger protein 737-like isoform X1 [Daphnia pulicaria]XP_046658023.1 zinc finger protein 737-like isoform X1 [Daphnia pulicaria]XP_046658024.1 zinc finger protein 737-like isoform X1 [Daphnia pulicaria]